MRRFGRNKKRALVERIANLERALKMNEGLMSYVTKNNYNLREQLAFIHHELDCNSALKPADIVDVADTSRPAFTMFHARDNLSFDALRGTDAIIRSVETKFMVNAYISSYKTRFDDQIHYHMAFGNESFGYAISKDALYGLSKEGLHQRLTEGFADMITRYIK